MTISSHHESLISRLRKELKTFSIARDVSAEDLKTARDLHNWTCAYQPNAHIEICGMIRTPGSFRGTLIMTGRVVQVHVATRLAVTTTGVYRLGRRQTSDEPVFERAKTISTELAALHSKLEEYRQDLDIACRYLAEITPVESSLAELDIKNSERRQLH